MPKLLKRVPSAVNTTGQLIISQREIPKNRRFSFTLLGDDGETYDLELNGKELENIISILNDLSHQ